MPLNIPENAGVVEGRAKADVQRELPESNPFLKNSWLGAIITGYANRVYDFYLQLEEAIKQSFPDTATGDYLTRWAAIWGKQLLAATPASGHVVATGVDTSDIPLGTVFTGAGGLYTSTASATISANVINVDSITRAGQTATVTTPSDHGLANNVEVTIAGAIAPEYDVTTAIVVIAADQFQYEVAGSPADDPTSSATCSYTSASVPVESDLEGADTNLDAGESLRLQSPLAGVDDSVTVDFEEIAGGTDQEGEESLRGRTLEKIQNPVAHFNAADIIDQAKTVAGVTRVFVEEVTPLVGQVTIYFMRDGDVDPIPTAPEIADVREVIEAITPANTSVTLDLFIFAPTPVVTDFTFSALTPNTASMKDAIDANLRQFFDESTEIGVNVDEDAYRSAIFTAVDTTNGDRVESFTLSGPVGDIVVAAGEIATLGNTVYP